MADSADVPSPRKRGRPPGSTRKIGGRAASAGKSATRDWLKEQKQTFVQEQILEAATELIAARGFRAVTIDDISESIGFTKSVIYYYLDSKNDILWRIFTQTFEKYFDSISVILNSDDGPHEKLHKVIRQHALNVMQNRDRTKIYFREEAELNDKQRRQIATKKRQYDAQIEEVYSDGVAKGLFKDMPAHVAIAGILGAINWIYTWYNPNGKTSADEIADHYANLLSTGFIRKP